MHRRYKEEYGLERCASRMMALYKELTQSDLKGEIPYDMNIRNLYVIYCLDQISNRIGFQIPEYAYGAFVREIARIYEECRHGFIAGEDHSSISFYRLSEAFLAYFLDSNMKLSQIDKISSYELAEAVVHYLD